MNDQLCTRQVCFIMSAYSAAGKLLMMPAVLSYYCAGDLWLPALALYALQTAAVWAAAYASSRTDKTFFALAEGALGKVAGKLLSWLFAAFFLLACVLPVLEQKLFVQSIFYDTIPSLVTFLPFFVFSVYVGAKGIRNAGRVADIVMPLFFAAFAALVIMSVGESDMSALQPVLVSSSPSRLFSGARFSLYNFADGAVMLMFMGRFAYKKGDAAKITLSYAASAFAVLLFLALFYSIFSSLAPDRYFAVGQIAVFFPALSLVGRVDLVAVYAVELCMLFALALYIRLAVACVCGALGKEQTKGRNVRPAAAVASLSVNVLLLAAAIIFNNSYLVVQEVFGRYLWCVYLAFAFVLPAVAATAARFARGARA